MSDSDERPNPESSPADHWTNEGMTLEEVTDWLSNLDLEAQVLREILIKAGLTTDADISERIKAALRELDQGGQAAGSALDRQTRREMKQQNRFHDNFHC